MNGYETELVIDPQAQTDETRALSTHLQRQRTDPGYYVDNDIRTGSAAGMGFFDGSTRTAPEHHSTMPLWPRPTYPSDPSYPGSGVPPLPPITITPSTGGLAPTIAIKASIPDGYVTAGVGESVTLVGIAYKMWIKMMTKDGATTRFLIVGAVETELTEELAEAIMRGART